MTTPVVVMPIQTPISASVMKNPGNLCPNNHSAGPAMAVTMSPMRSH